MKAALAIGGSTAALATRERFGLTGTASGERLSRGHQDDQDQTEIRTRSDSHDAGRISNAERDNRQHAWDAYERFNPDHGVSVTPEHNVALLLEYQYEGEPDPEHRAELERALRQVERAFEWSHEGVLFTIGYTHTYFDRFAEPLPDGLQGPPGFPRIDTTLEATTVGLEKGPEDIAADRPDAILHLSSDNAANLLAVEEALWGEQQILAGVEVEATLEGIFERPTEYPGRRTGFAGEANLEDAFADLEFDADRIPEGSDLSMGFNDLFSNSVPRESNATITHDQFFAPDPRPPGMFAQGTTMHLSKLDVSLEEWYDDFSTAEPGTEQHRRENARGRRERMFSPHHDREDVGEVGENLGRSNAPATDGNDRLPMRDLDGEGIAEKTQADAERDGQRIDPKGSTDAPVGHVQKIARARFDLESRKTDPDEEPVDDAIRQDGDLAPGHDGTQESEQVILRRDVVSTDQDRPGNMFVALARFGGYMHYVRQAMNGVEFDTASFELDGEGRLVHDAVDIADTDNGIVEYLDTKRRANALVPPLWLRSLPPARSLDAEWFLEPFDDEGTIDRGEDFVTVAITQPDPTRDIVPESIRFGEIEAVNRAQGATPVDWVRRDNRGRYEDERELWLYVRTEDLDLSTGTATFRLRGKRNDGHPFVADREIEVVDHGGRRGYYGWHHDYNRNNGWDHDYSWGNGWNHDGDRDDDRHSRTNANWDDEPADSRTHG